MMGTFFWYSLALKVVMTAGIVVAASVLVERSGPFIGALIAALPTAGGAALIILALEHPPAFIAQSAVGSIVSNAVCAFFALSYAALAQRRSLSVALSGAYLVWLVFAALARTVEWTAESALVLNGLVYSVTIYLASRFRVDGAPRRVTLTGRDVAWRAGVVTLCVVVVTAASSWIGSFASGFFAFFPVAMGSFFIILHMRLGGPAAASVAAYVQAPLIGLGLAMATVHYLAVPVGVWWSYLVGLSVGVGWNALLWWLRGLRKPA